MGGEEDLVAVEGEGAGRGPLGGIVGQRPSILPDDVAGDRVYRLHHVPRTREEHHAVVHERRRLVVALADGQHPGELQLVDVVARDPVQRTVAVAVARPPPAQPVAGRRVGEQRVGDRGQLARHLPVDEPRRPPPRRLAPVGRAARLGHVRRITDGDRGIGRQRRVAGPGAVRIEDVRDEVQVDPVGERSAQAGGHLVAHVREQLVRRLPRPAVQEVDPAQGRRLRPVQPLAVALSALPRVHRPAGGGLLRREGPLRARGLRRHGRAARPHTRFAEGAARHDQSGHRHPDPHRRGPDESSPRHDRTPRRRPRAPADPGPPVRRAASFRSGYARSRRPSPCPPSGPGASSSSPMRGRRWLRVIERPAVQRLPRRCPSASTSRPARVRAPAPPGQPRRHRPADLRPARGRAAETAVPGAKCLRGAGTFGNPVHSSPEPIRPGPRRLPRRSGSTCSRC